MIKLLFVFIILLLFVWRIKKGFANGMMQELVNIFSGMAALVCAALVFFVVNSIFAKTTSVLILCVIALIVLGIAFKLCSLMFKPLLAIGNIAVIGGLNKVLGAVLGICEAGVSAFLLYKILDYILPHFGVYFL